MHKQGTRKSLRICRIRTESQAFFSVFSGLVLLELPVLLEFLELPVLLCPLSVLGEGLGKELLQGQGMTVIGDRTVVGMNISIFQNFEKAGL